MNTPKHTPGPWTVLTPYTDRNVYPIGHPIDENAMGILAEVNSQGGMEADCRANAELIASAPALLAERDQLKADNARLQSECPRKTLCYLEAESDDLTEREDWLDAMKALNPSPKGWDVID